VFVFFVDKEIVAVVMVSQQRRLARWDTQLF